MLYLEAYGLKKYFGDRLLFDIPVLKVYEGDRIGIVGANGSGKTTLVGILAGEMEPDEGTVRRFAPAALIHQLEPEAADAPEQELRRFGVADLHGREGISGGEQTRIRIANALARQTPLILADEPTANLDMDGVALLGKRLAGASSLVLISHDRALLNDLCTTIWEIDRLRLRVYPGNYESYRRLRDQELARRWDEYEQYIDERDHLKAAIDNRSRRAASVRKTPSRMGNSEARLHKRDATEKQEKLHDAARALKTRLEQLEKKEKPRETETIHIDFSLTDPPGSRTVFSARDLRFAYGSRMIFDHARFEVAGGLRTALLGPNGAGKTTLLTLMTDGHPDIRTAPRARLGTLYQSAEDLNPAESVLDNVMRDSVQSQSAVRTILARLLFRGEDVFKPAGVLSGGERVRAAMARLVVSRANVLLLDEPTNYLDIESMEAMESVLRDYEGTVLLASHDRQFVSSVAQRLLFIENGHIQSFDGSLADWERARNAPPPLPDDAERRVLLLRLAEVTSRLSLGTADREQAEQTYDALRARLQELDEGQNKK